MIRLIVIVLVAALAWMIWWAIGQTAYEKGLAFTIDELRNEGWTADFSSLNTAGFPNRFDTTATELRLSDPVSGISWSAPIVQILSLAYKPHQVIAVLPDSHELRTPFETLTINHNDARASIFLKPDTQLPLDEARLIIDQLEIVSNRGWNLSLREARFAVENVWADNDRYHVGAEMLSLRLPEKTSRMLDPDSKLPMQIENVRLDAELTFDRPIVGRSDDRTQPQIKAIDLRNASAHWGDITLSAFGTMTLDSAGIPEGKINLKAKAWRQVFDAAKSAGLIPPESSETVLNGLELLSGGTDSIETSLQITNGIVWFGLIPLGPAQRLFGG